MGTKALWHLLFSCSISACAPGFLYTDVVTPLDTNLTLTPLGHEASIGEGHEFKEPFTSFGIRTEWGSQAIGDVAKTTHLHEISYADQRVISVLGGIWRRRSIIVYGRK